MLYLLLLHRHLEGATLQFDQRHPGHLDAFEIFKPHVLAWIAASQQRLSGQCNQLETSAQPGAGGKDMMGKVCDTHIQCVCVCARARACVCRRGRQPSQGTGRVGRA